MQNYSDRHLKKMNIVISQKKSWKPLCVVQITQKAIKLKLLEHRFISPRFAKLLSAEVDIADCLIW